MEGVSRSKLIPRHDPVEQELEWLQNRLLSQTELIDGLREEIEALEASSAVLASSIEGWEYSSGWPVSYDLEFAKRQEQQGGLLEACSRERVFLEKDVHSGVIIPLIMKMEMTTMMMVMVFPVVH